METTAHLQMRGTWMGEKLTPGQCRAARALLFWSQDTLAKNAKVGISSVYNFERNRRGVSDDTIRSIRLALELAGAEFNGGVTLGRPRK